MSIHETASDAVAYKRRDKRNEGAHSVECLDGENSWREAKWKGLDSDALQTCNLIELVYWISTFIIGTTLYRFG